MQSLSRCIIYIHSLYNQKFFHFEAGVEEWPDFPEASVIARSPRSFALSTAGNLRFSLYYLQIPS